MSTTNLAENAAPPAALPAPPLVPSSKMEEDTESARGGLRPPHHGCCHDFLRHNKLTVATIAAVVAGITLGVLLRPLGELGNGVTCLEPALRWQGRDTGFVTSPKEACTGADLTRVLLKLARSFVTFELPVPLALAAPSVYRRIRHTSAAYLQTKHRNLHCLAEVSQQPGGTVPFDDSYTFVCSYFYCRNFYDHPPGPRHATA